MGYVENGKIWVDTRFRSAFVLLTRPVGAVGLAARLEAFGTRSNGGVVDDEYDDKGWSAMLAAKREWAPVTGLVELLHVSSRREDREDTASATSNAAPGPSANPLVTILAW